MRIDGPDDFRVKHLDPDGPLISTSEDATDLLGDTWGENISLIAVPVERFDPLFFDLRTRKAGEIAQKLVNYRMRLAVVGDISEHEGASDAFSAFVWESNRGDHVWFVPDDAALEDRLATRSARLDGGAQPQQQR